MSTHRWQWLVMAPMIAMVASGCGTVRMAVVEPTIPAVVDSGLETLTTEENQDRIRTLLNLVEVGETTEQFVAAALESALAELSREERQRQLSGLVDALVGAVTAALAEGTTEEIGPAVTVQVESVVRSSLDVLLADEVRRDAAAFVRTVTEALTRTLGQELEAATRERFGPALAATLERDLLPSLGRGLDTEIGPALARTSRNVGRQAALGFSDALSGELGEAINAQVAGVLGQGGDAARDLSRLLFAVLGVLILGLVGLGYVLRKYVKLVHARDRALELVTSTAKEYTQAGSPAFVRMVKSNGEGTVGGRALSDFLGERGHLKANLR